LKRRIFRFDNKKYHNNYLFLELAAYWDEIDLDDSGVVTMAEVHQFLTKLKIKIPEDKKADIESHLDR